MAFFARQTKLTLESPVKIDDLTIVSGKFEYIKPSGATGEFIATTDNVNNRIFYDIQTVNDIDEFGVWKIWASYQDATGDVTRAETTDVDFKDPDK